MRKKSNSKLSEEKANKQFAKKKLKLMLRTPEPGTPT